MPITREELQALKDLRSFIDRLLRLYFQRRLSLAARLIAGARLDAELSAQEVGEMWLVE